MAVQHLAKWPAEVKYASSPQRRSACAHLALRSLGRLLADFVGCAMGMLCKGVAPNCDVWDASTRWGSVFEAVPVPHSTVRLGEAVKGNRVLFVKTQDSGACCITTRSGCGCRRESAERRGHARPAPLAAAGRVGRVFWDALAVAESLPACREVHRVPPARRAMERGPPMLLLLPVGVPMKPSVVFANCSSCACGRAVARPAAAGPDVRTLLSAAARGVSDGRSALRMGRLSAGDLTAGDEDPARCFCLSPGAGLLVPRSGRAVFGGAGPRGLWAGLLCPRADNSAPPLLSAVPPPGPSICDSLETAACARLSCVLAPLFLPTPAPIPPSRGVCEARGVCGGAPWIVLFPPG